MTTPKYHRDRRITVAIFTTENGCSLTVNVVEDRVEVSSVGYWSCSDVSPLVNRLHQAAVLAAEWTDRDCALAALLDRREYNSGFWMPAVRKVTQEYLGELLTPQKEAEIHARVQDAREKAKAARGCPSVFPRLLIQFDEIKMALTVEPLWDEIEEFRWVEPDAS